MGLIGGTDDTTNVYKDSVFLLEDYPRVGTGFAAIRKERCLITAAHVYDKEGNLKARTVNQSVARYDRLVKQFVAAGETRWHTDQPIGKKHKKLPYIDIAILWLTGHRDDPTFGMKTWIDTYIPFNLANAPWPTCRAI
jgi:hypothetical protein